MSRANPLSLMRLRGFLRKETLQILRDPSSLLLGIVMPVVLLFIFGYGVSLDPQNVPIALVIQDDSPAAADLSARLELSRYFRTTRATSLQQAENLLRAGRIDGIVHVRSDYTKRHFAASQAPVQLIVNGVDANRARLIQSYVQGAVARWSVIAAARGTRSNQPLIRLDPRIWFNAAAESTYFLVPGLLTLIMTLIGTLLTALVIAREWERGTMEAILATPLRSEEILLGKILPYFVLGMAGMGLAVLLGITLFGVPLRGSLGLLLLLSALFLLASLGLGLLISAATRVQFVAAQIAVVIGFLPAFFLSGLLFELHSTPTLVQAISHLIPAKYFVTISQTLFMAGDIGAVLLPAGGVLALMACLLIANAKRKLGQRLPQ